MLEPKCEMTFDHPERAGTGYSFQQCQSEQRSGRLPKMHVWEQGLLPREKERDRVCLLFCALLHKGAPKIWRCTRAIRRRRRHKKPRRQERGRDSGFCSGTEEKGTLNLVGRRWTDWIEVITSLFTQLIRPLERFSFKYQPHQLILVFLIVWHLAHIPGKFERCLECLCRARTNLGLVSNNETP